jgi:hypothetical protein
MDAKELQDLNKPRVWFFDQQGESVFLQEPPCFHALYGYPLYCDTSYWEEGLPEDFKAPGVGLWVFDGVYEAYEFDGDNEEERDPDLAGGWQMRGTWRPASIDDLVRTGLLSSSLPF